MCSIFAALVVTANLLLMLTLVPASIVIADRWKCTVPSGTCSTREEHGGQIKGPPDTPRQYGTEEFNGDLHYAERVEPSERPMKKFPVWCSDAHPSPSRQIVNVIPDENLRQSLNNSSPPLENSIPPLEHSRRHIPLSNINKYLRNGSDYQDPMCEIPLSGGDADFQLSTFHGKMEYPHDKRENFHDKKENSHDKGEHFHDRRENFHEKSENTGIETVLKSLFLGNHSVDNVDAPLDNVQTPDVYVPNFQQNSCKSPTNKSLYSPSIRANSSTPLHRVKKFSFKVLSSIDVYKNVERFLVTGRVPLVVIFGGLAVLSGYLVLESPGLKLPDTEEFQLFRSDHYFERYDLSDKYQFWFERQLEAEASTRLPIRIVWGVKPIDDGDQFDPFSRGALQMDDSFNMLGVAAQEWMLQFCRDLRKQDFYLSSMGPLLPNCFMETFKSWMEERRCYDGDTNRYFDISY